MTLNPEYVADLEKEWRREGRSDEEIGQRLRKLAEQSEQEADGDEPSKSEPEPELEHPGAPTEEWPLCPACGGNGRVPPELQKSKRVEPCPDCAGMGSVLTGSLVPEHAILPCVTCSGNGYRDVSQPPPAKYPEEQGYRREW